MKQFFTRKRILQLFFINILLIIVILAFGAIAGYDPFVGALEGFTIGFYAVAAIETMLILNLSLREKLLHSYSSYLFIILVSLYSIIAIPGESDLYKLFGYIITTPLIISLISTLLQYFYSLFRK